jgi:hypothetical protein
MYAGSSPLDMSAHPQTYGGNLLRTARRRHLLMLLMPNSLRFSLKLGIAVTEVPEFY